MQSVFARRRGRVRDYRRRYPRTVGGCVALVDGVRDAIGEEYIRF